MQVFLNNMHNPMEALKQLGQCETLENFTLKHRSKTITSNIVHVEFFLLYFHEVIKKYFHPHPYFLHMQLQVLLQASFSSHPAWYLGSYVIRCVKISNTARVSIRIGAWNQMRYNREKDHTSIFQETPSQGSGIVSNITNITLLTAVFSSPLQWMDVM